MLQIQFDKLFKNKTSNIFIQMFRYLFSGGIAFVFDKSIFLLTRYYFDINKYVSTTISFVIGLIITYILSILWVFNERRLKDSKTEILIFSIIGVIGLLLMNFFMWLFSQKAHISIDFVSNLLATALVTIWNFAAKKTTLFTKK